MRMQVMRIGHVGMRVPQRRVLVGVAVWPRRHHVMGMQVVAVVVRMGVFVFEGLVVMGMAVRL